MEYIDFFLTYFEYFLFFFLLLLGFFVGSCLEKRHFTLIKERELRFKHLPALSTSKLPQEYRVDNCWLVGGEVMISIDYFKRIMAYLQSFVGWNVTVYESLVDRARREAILRMKAYARSKNADLIINVRIETSAISGRSGNNKTAGVEVYAYGTAIKLSAN